MTPIMALVNILGTTTLNANEIASLTDILKNNLGISSSRFEVNETLFPNMSYDTSASAKYFSSRILQNTTNSNNTTTTNTSNSSSISNLSFKIPDIGANSLKLSILLLPELNDTNAINMFQALTRLKTNLDKLVSACKIYYFIKNF